MMRQILADRPAPPAEHGLYVKGRSMLSHSRLAIFMVFWTLVFLSGCGGGSSSGGGDGTAPVPDRTPPVTTQ